MDVTDLPVPLSRIEKLWNCLITGETPDFEPLSRNEKYLMAMLDRYDISNLPAPISRGEKLLYKIAVGETDLSDVPGYLSRYEELLKYLIENGGISGGDFEYVLYTINQSLYTLYTTAEKPVKSAILKGQTLVNLVPKQIIDYTATSDWDGFKALGQNSATQERWRVLQDLKPNTKYFISCYVETFNVGENKGYLLNNSAYSTVFAEYLEVKATGLHKWVLTSKSEFTEQVSIALRCQNKNARGVIKIRDIMIVEYQQGMENWDIPYFEGMQSVKMPVLTTTGKNLFDGELMLGNVSGGNGIDLNSNQMCRTNYIKVTPGSDFTASIEGNYVVEKISEVDKDKNFIKTTEKSIPSISVTLTNSTSFIRCVFKHINNPNEFSLDEVRESKIQLEESPTATPYEPYKTNILTVNEEVELRGIGDVKDTLDLLTGEVTERIGEIVFNGGDEYTWTKNTVSENTIRFQSTNVPIPTQPDANILPNILCDKLKVVKNINWQNDEEQIEVGIGAPYKYEINIRINKTKLNSETVDSFKEYLQTNPITIQYSLATESIKTVDLTTVDQDNQPTKLGTFENITRVLLESAGLIPEVEMEVATNLLEDTVFNLTNAFNTLYPTAAKPVKSAILKGQTLVNLTKNSDVYFKLSPTDVWQNTPTIDTENRCCLSVINIQPNTKYIMKILSETSQIYVRFYNSNDNICNGNTGWINSNTTFTTLSDTTRIYITFRLSENNEVYSDISQCSSILLLKYQDGMENWDIPYFEGMQSVQAPGVTITNEDGTKSITLSTPSDLELRKVGDVQDEVNVMTGEVTQYINEVIINGSSKENWKRGGMVPTDTTLIRFDLTNVSGVQNGLDKPLSCDKFPYIYIHGLTGGSKAIKNECISNHSNDADSINLVIKKERLTKIDITGLKKWLNENPITIQYQLKTPTTKTVDLTVVNQDGNTTKLRTFDDTTHVLLQSEAGSNPTASLTVKTKIPSASSTSLLMDDISDEQEQLNTTVDEQSNNVDATMIATTEIYEETL